MSVNKAILIGRLGKDPDVRYMTDGTAVANVSLATSEVWKDKSGERQEKTEWHNLVLYKRLAEIAGEYLKKGALIYVEGRIQTRKWQDKEGNDRYTTEIVVGELKMLGDKKDGAQQGGERQPARSAQAPQRQAPQSGGSGSSFDNFDDDIPFAHCGMNGAGVGWRAMV